MTEKIIDTNIDVVFGSNKKQQFDFYPERGLYKS